MVAGCGFATYVIQAYCSGPIKGFGAVHPLVGLSLYIDDFTGVVTARDDDDAMLVLTEGMVDLRRVIEDELRCCIAVDKSQIVASSPLLRRATRVLGALGGRAVASVEALGIDLPAQVQTWVLERISEEEESSEGKGQEGPHQEAQSGLC